MPTKDRLSRIFENARSKPDVTAIVNGAHADPNFFYISGYRSGLFEGNMLFLFPDRHVEILTNPLEEEAARQKPEFKVHVERSHAPLERRKMVSFILKGCKRVGVNFRGISHRDYQELKGMLGSREVLDVSGAFDSSRMIKDPDELKALSKAAKIISAVVDDVPNLVEEGMTERALKATIDYRMVEEGADSPSFESIVAFGENSAFPHYSAGDRKVRKGDNILIDIGASYQRYCSDITRTFFFGQASADQKEAYSTVLEAQERAIKGIREGVTGKAVHQIAAHTIDRSKFKGRFTHGLGHSLGLEVHDGLGLSPRNPNKLKKNMVLTVEPGIYIPRQGGVRIEDDVVVTKDACKVLTTSSKDLIEI